MAFEFDYGCVPTIRQFALSNAFIRALVGPFGSGKSSGCVAEIGRRGREQRPGPDGRRRTRWAAIRNTYGELADTTIRTFFQWFPPEHFGKWHATERRYVIDAFKDCEIEILFRALDDADDVKKLLSLDLTGAWVNEAREVPWPVVDALQGRLGRYPPQNEGGPSWYGMVLDTNPPDSDSRFYKFFEEGVWQDSFEALIQGRVLAPDAKPTDFAAIFHQPSGLSPEAENLPNLPAGYYQRLAIGKKPEWVKVYIHGQYGFISDDKAVFPEFSEQHHLKEIEPVRGLTVYRGWDFGLSPACGLSQILPDGRWLIFDEIIAESMGADNISDEVIEHCARTFKGNVDFEDYGDPAGQSRAETDERSCFQILQAKNIAIEPGLQTLALRLESIRKPLTKLLAPGPQLILHPRCKMMRKAFLGGYHYRRLATNAERYATKPEKNEFSHIMDGNEYVATMLFGGPLTELGAGDDGPPRQRDERGRSPVTGY